ncbi:MAG: hypothetical protein ACYSWU_11390, partial [Planctomycetota bacterium]
MTEPRPRDYVEGMAATTLAMTLGVEFDPETAYDERKEVYHMSGKIVRTRACVQTAEGNKAGLWTTVVVATLKRLGRLSRRDRRSRLYEIRTCSTPGGAAESGRSQVTRLQLVRV